MTEDNGKKPTEDKAGFMANCPPALRGWLPILACLAALFVWVIILFWPAASNAVYLWAHRSTYNHGFLILPIAAYLIWDRRAKLATLRAEPWVLGLPGLFAVSAIWFVVYAAGIMEGEHFLIVGMFQAIIVTLLGWRLYGALLLPMNYLWLMVPTGTLLFPVLQKIATVISAWLLQLSGVPVFAEGFLISVPTGFYAVAEGCSGLNFILSTLALAPLYAVFVYNSMRKRVIAVAVAVAISILANAVRIYAIIALAEFTNRRIDIVDDHLLYGWGFFLVILLLMGWIGMRFADPEDPKPAVPTEGLPTQPIRKVILITALAALALSLPPLYGWIAGFPALDLGFMPATPGGH